MARVTAETMSDGGAWIRLELEKDDKGSLGCQAPAWHGSSIVISHVELSTLALLRDKLTEYLEENGARPLKG